MLQPDKLKKLNDNARKMSEAGSSQEDIMAMRDAFIKQFGNEIPLKKKSVSESPSEDGSLVSPKSTKQTKKPSTTIPKKDEEEDYFTGAFGNVLRGFDSVVPLGIGDFVDDMARSVASGYRQGEVAQSANDLLLKGHKSSPEQIQKFIDANKNAQQLKPSAEMQNYNKIYEEEGKGFWGVIKGLANNPTIIPEVITSSLVSMATNTDALKAGGAALGAGATRGAVVGAAATPEFLGAGALPGAATGAASAIPYAFGLASSVVEAGATFGELLQEELGGKDLSKENVKAILENPEKLKSIRNKAIARGVIIGTVDALTGKLASGVGAKILSKSAAKSAAGVATKGAVTRATAAGAGIESLGGSAGEATARGAIGQDMDVSEIALEGLAELPGGVRSTIQAKLAKPSYKVNGVNVQAQDIDDLIETMTPEQLASTKIDIKNDYEGRQFKIQDKIITNSIKEQVKQANPELNETSLDAITELEKSLKSLEGNTTQTGKDKAAALRQQIKNIQENQLEAEAVTETLNSEQDAIQEQSTAEVPVQSETGISETMEEGISEPKSEIATEQITQEEVTAPQTIIEAIEDRTGAYSYDGKKGAITTIGQTVVLETDNEIIDLGNVDELKDSTLEDFGIIKAEDILLNDDNSVSIGEVKYLNNYSNPDAAISQDKDGNYSITLDTENGQKRTFRGQQADQIVYQMKLKNFEQNGTEQQIEQANELADEAIRIEAEVGTPSAEREGKTVRKAKRKQRTLKTIKEPLTKAERDSEENNLLANTNQLSKVEDSPSLSVELNKLKQQRESIKDFYKRYLKAKEEGTDSELVSSVDRLLETKVDPFEGMLKSGTEVVYNGKKGRIKEVSNFAGIREYNIVFDSAKGPTSRFISLEEFNRNGKPAAAVAEEVKAPTPVVEEVAPVAEEVTIEEATPVVEESASTKKPSLEQIMENSRKQFDAIQSEVDEFNSVNNRVYKGRTKKELESDLYEAKEKLYNAQKNISRSEDADEAIAEYNKAKKNVAKVESQIQELNDFNKVSGFVFEQIDSSKKSDYEFKDLFNKDPRLAAIQDAKEMIEWFKSQEGREEDVAKYNNDVKLLEQDIKNYPIKSKQATAKKESKLDKEIAQLESDITSYESDIESATDDIETETQNTKEFVAETKKKIADAKKDKTLTKEERIEKVEQLESELEDFVDEQDAIIDGYKDTLKEAKSELKKTERKLAKLLSQKENDVNELLDLDTKDKGSLKRVLDFLDRADEALNLDPNELNDVTRVMAIATAKAIVKTLKALVNAGITLQEAINNVSEIYEITSDKIIDALDIVSKINENVSEGISEMEAPGYNKLSKDIDNMIDNDSDLNEVLDSVKDSDVYKNATDVQREALVRDVRKRFGIREKSAPSVAKLFGKIKDVKKITMREKDLLIKQIKDKAKGAKDAVVAFKKINQELAKDIDELVKTGKITAKQAANVIKKFSKVNPFSYKSVNGFVDYMSKLFNNADYANNLSNAKSLRKEIKKLSKNDKKNAQLTNLAAEFSKIDPSMVDNIENYNEQALKLKKAIVGSNLRGGKLNVADTVDINEVSGYVSETIEQQEIKIREQQIAELQDLLGVDASEFSAVEIEELLKPDTKIDNDKEKIIRSAIKKAFDIYSSMIKEQIKTGVDAFTGDNVSYTEDQKELIKRFMNMDPNNMDVKDALAAIDSLVNFLVNQSTARMETVVQQYEKTQNAKEIADKGITSVPLRKYFSPKLGRFLAEQTSNIGLLLEKAFVGFNRSAVVKKAMGYYELANGAAKAVSQSNKIVDDYVKQFYDKKANGQEFNTLFNMVERGMTSFVIRNIIGNESKSKAEFARRKNLVKETIDALLEYGNEQERNEGAEYQKVYDKILKDSNTAEEVMSKVDNQNLEAVNWWIDQWSSKFDRLSDLALNIYNTVLGRDVNYTPDKFKKFSSDESIEDLSNNESAFVNNTDGVTYKKESSGLMKATRPETLPTNNKTKTPRSYIDLSFDKVNANAMYDALVDLETAAPIRGIEAFMNSPYFSKIIKSKEDAKLIRGRINNYIRNTRNKSMFSNDELSTAFKALNKIATLGASQALGGPTQPFKQVIPVAFNTFINSGGNLELSATFNPEFMKWFKDSGFATGNRGIESLAEIDSINRLVEQAANSKGAKFWKAIEKANEKQLKVLLSNPDRWIAITSWKTYYEQSLKDQGKEPDYSKGEINETAANYAEEMVSRQQNVSDKNMSGNLFTAKDTPTTVLVKLLMPFGSFRMNQSTRIGSDMRVLEYWNTSSKEDKLIAARSLAGFATEQVMFKTVSLAFALVFNEIASSIMGNTDDEEDEKRRDAIYKGQATGIITDIFSPLPIFDKPIQGMASYSLSTVQEAMDIPEDDMIALYGMGKEDFSKGLGMFGITIGRASEIYETIGLSLTGKYKDNFGRTKQISEDKRSSLSTLIGPMLVSNITGVASPEVSSIVRNSVRYAKKSPKPIDKELLKKNSPEEYEKMYGKGGTMYKIEERKKEIEKRLEEIKKRR